MKKKVLFFLMLFAVVFMKTGIAQEKKNVYKRGAGSFEFIKTDALVQRTVTLFYYVPTQGDIRNMKVLFSMHGAERNGQTQRNIWMNLAEEYGFIVLAPQFTQANGFTNNDYQFGGVSTNLDRLVLNPSGSWTFQIIEQIFDDFKNCTGNLSEIYHMFGHSGGGQFVHRHLLVMPEARVGRAIVANPGSYTFPDNYGVQENNDLADVVSWPYSTRGTPFAADEYLIPFFKRDIIYMAGTLDTASVPANLSVDHPINQQGAHRYARACNFFNFSQSMAQEKGYEFNWHFKEVVGVGHSTIRMLYGNADVRSWQINGNDRVYNNEDLTEMGAFHLLKELLLSDDLSLDTEM